MRYILTFCAFFLSAAHVMAEQVNASAIATGTFTNLNWATVGAIPDIPLGGMVTVRTMTRTRVSLEGDSYFDPGPWSSSWSNAVAFPNFSRQVMFPAAGMVNGFYTTYSPQTNQRGTVNMPGMKTSSTAAKTGSAFTVVTYSAKINHAGPEAGYFLTIKNPNRSAKADLAWSLCCSGDSNGGTYTYHDPNSAQSRSAIDIYANSLPVWSSETSRIYKSKQEPFVQNGAVDTQFGWALNSNDMHKIFLGKLKSGESMTVTLTLRTDAVVDAPKCGEQVTNNQFEPNKPYKDIHCFSATEDLSPVANNGPFPIPGMNITAKQF
jgi:hypothetical protein